MKEKKNNYLHTPTFTLSHTKGNCTPYAHQRTGVHAPTKLGESPDEHKAHSFQQPTEYSPYKSSAFHASDMLVQQRL